jgi:hypothetical protein
MPMKTQSPAPRQSPSLNEPSPNDRLLESLSTQKEHQREPNFLGHVVITGTLILVSFVGYSLQVRMATQRMAHWLAPVKEIAQARDVIAKNLEERSPDLKPPSPAEQEILADQYRYAASRAAQLSDMTSFFYGRYHGAVSLAAISTLVAGISVFAVSKQGWDRANPVFGNFLVTASAAAIFYGNLPGIFMYEEGFNASWKLHQDYLNLTQEINSFTATGGVIGQNPDNSNEYSIMDTNRFIHYINRRLTALNQQPVGFNRANIANLGNFDSSLPFPTRPQ